MAANHAIATTLTAKSIEQGGNISKTRKKCLLVLGLMVGVIIIIVVTSVSIYFSNHNSIDITSDKLLKSSRNYIAITTEAMIAEVSTKSHESVDCEYSGWIIGECSQSCGGGIRTNTRTEKYTVPSWGIECGQPTSIEESCNMQQCPAHCPWNDWIIGDCSQTCGGGIRTNTRTEKYTPENGGIECDQPTSIEESCNMEQCPAHCQWNDWIIGDCSQSCGEGVRTNIRTEKYAVENGDRKCDQPTSIEENCNMKECVECRDDPSGLATSPDTDTTVRCTFKAFCHYSWFTAQCPRTCGMCGGGCSDIEIDTTCNSFKNNGYCSSEFEDWMRVNCKKSCGFC